MTAPLVLHLRKRTKCIKFGSFWYQKTFATPLFEEITLARVSSTLHRFFDKLAQTDLLILDDFGVKVLDGQQLLDFMEIIEDRHGRKATIIMSQLPVADWYDVLRNNTTAADAILDRIVHTSVRFELKGSSMRRKKTKNLADSQKND